MAFQLGATRDAFLAIATMSAVLHATSAHADLTCQDFTRAYVLQDDDVLAQAREIARPWSDARLALLKADNNVMMDRAFMEQLSNECRSLPTDTIDRIVATHLKRATRELAERKAVEQAASTLPFRGRASPGTPLGNDTAVLSKDERDAIGNQVRECWAKDAGALDIEKQQVLLTVTIDAEGNARKAEVAGDDIARMEDRRFRIFAERARKAVLDPRCASNLPLPTNVLGKVRTMTFRFTP